MGKLSISIVNFDSDSIDTCLNSIDYGEVYVIDNSGGNKQFKAKVIRSRNNGFGAGHNLAIMKTNAKYHLVLNPDMILGKGVLKKLVDHMDKNPRIGAISPKILDKKRRIQHLCRRNPDLLSLIFSRLGIKSRRLSMYQMRDKDYGKSFDVPFVSGSFMLLRRSVLKKTGLFDKRFFLYFEDADLSRRISKISRIVYYPSLSVVHDWKGGSRRSLKLFFIHLKSMFLYFNKWGWKLF